MEASDMKAPARVLLFLFTHLTIVAGVFAAPTETTLKVEHMDCATCPVVVRAALYDLEGVDEVKVSMEEKTVDVRYDDELVTEENLAQAITNAGFPAKVRK
jgi:mercuric ion binding protein